MNAAATAPASSGNIGPGFDVLGLAYELRCRVTAAPSDSWSVVERGETYSPQPDSLVMQAASAAANDPMLLRIDNDIPRARGLGSSAALATAVAAATLRAKGIEPTSEQLLYMVAELEGHYDNAAAAVYGGGVVASDGRWLQLEIHPDLVFVAAIPEARLATRDARQVLAPTVDRATVARSLARAVFLVNGLRTSSVEAFAGAAGDELHEAPRAHLSPITGTLMEAAYTAGALHAAWSGAGPTALAITTAEMEHTVKKAMHEALGNGGSVVTLHVAQRGWS